MGKRKWGRRLFFPRPLAFNRRRGLAMAEERKKTDGAQSGKSVRPRSAAFWSRNHSPPDQWSIVSHVCCGGSSRVSQSCDRDSGRVTRLHRSTCEKPFVPSAVTVLNETLHLFTPRRISCGVEQPAPARSGHFDASLVLMSKCFDEKCRNTVSNNIKHICLSVC